MGLRGEGKWGKMGKSGGKWGTNRQRNLPPIVPPIVPPFPSISLVPPPPSITPISPIIPHSPLFPPIFPGFPFSWGTVWGTSGRWMGNLMGLHNTHHGHGVWLLTKRLSMNGWSYHNTDCTKIFSTRLSTRIHANLAKRAHAVFSRHGIVNGSIMGINCLQGGKLANCIYFSAL